MDASRVGMSGSGTGSERRRVVQRVRRHLRSGPPRSRHRPSSAPRGGWESGAAAWTATEREEYANDLGDPRSLIAVTARSNRAKGKKDPAEWQPPYAGNSCAYNTDWVAVKWRWGQSDPVEKTALTDRLSRCPDVPVTVTRVR